MINRLVFSKCSILPIKIIFFLFLLSCTGVVQSQVLEVTAPQNAYAHIYRDFPTVPDGAQEIVLEARLFAPRQATETAWLSSIALYWSPAVYVKVGQSGSGVSRVMAPGTIGTRGGQSGGDVGIPGDIWVESRIVINKQRIEIWVRGEGDWILVGDDDLSRSGNVRSEIRTTFPTQIIVGKGHRGSSGTTEHLDESAPPDRIGTVQTTYVSDLVLRVDGEEVLKEDFKNLDSWEIHVDPLYADKTHIRTIDAIPGDSGGEGGGTEVGDGSVSPPESIWAPQFQRHFELPDQARIPIMVDWDDNEVERVPVTFGVPFPRGLIHSTQQLRLIADGCKCDVVPTQFEVTSTWDGPEGSIRWVLLSATLEKGREYFLEYGNAVSARGVADGIEVNETEDTIIVTTGPLRAEISKRRATILDSAGLDLDGDGIFSEDEMIVTRELSGANLPVVVDARGNEYVASSEDLKVEVARSGPMEVAVRREGWYIGRDGTRFAQFVTYTYFYHGQTGLRHDHTFVTAFDSTKHQIRDIRLSLPLRVEHEAQAIFARDGSPNGNVLSVGPESFPASLVQTSYNAWTLASGSQTVADGDRAGGWFGLSDDRWGAVAGWRDFWQQYPAQLEVDNGILHMHLWPSQGVDPLDFMPSAVMGDDYTGDQIFHNNFYQGGLDAWTQAYGIGKTHNIWIGFHANDERDEAARLTRSFINKPVLALSSPEWNGATEVLGRVHPEDRERFGELEGIIDAIVHRKLWLRERLGNYGWINFGDVNNSLRFPLDEQRVTHQPWRRWASTIYGGPNIYPLLYFRSGRRDVWDFHRTNTKHITDIDMSHLDHEGFRKYKGAIYRGNSSGESMIAHYLGDPNLWIRYDDYLFFMLMDYYMNGNLRVWEVANYYADFNVQRVDQPPYRSYRHRGTGGPLRFFSEAYEATWDPRYLEAMHLIAPVLLDGLEIEEQYNGVGSTRHDDVYMNEGKWKYYQLTGEEWMRDLFLNDMRVLAENRNYHVHEDIRHTTMWGPSMAYWMTGDEEFLDFVYWQLEVALGPDPTGVRHFIPTSGDPALIGATGQTLEHAYHATLGNQLPRVMHMLADVGLPISYLLSNPRTIVQADARAEDGQDRLVVFAPDSFTPPPFHEPVRVYFRVPEESVNPGIRFTTPVRLFNPDGQPANEGSGVLGWFDLPTDQPGLWSFEPLSTIPRYQVQVRNVPPFFALEDPNRYFEPDLPWIEWQSPMPDAVIRGEVPIDFKVYKGYDPVDVSAVRVYVEDKLIYTGSALPRDLIVNSLDLEDRKYRFRVEVEVNGEVVDAGVDVAVHNWWIFQDELRAPVGGGGSFGGFFGTEPIDLSLTSDKSSGWQYATDRRADFSGDNSRMVRRDDTTEHLIWDWPETGFNSYEVIVYVREDGVEALDDTVHLSVRTESTDEWTKIPYRIVHQETTGSGWQKVVLTGSVDTISTKGQFRLVVEAGRIPAHALQLGRVDLAGHRK